MNNVDHNAAHISDALQRIRKNMGQPVREPYHDFEIAAATAYNSAKRAMENAAKPNANAAAKTRAANAVKALNAAADELNADRAANGAALERIMKEGTGYEPNLGQNYVNRLLKNSLAATQKKARRLNAQGGRRRRHTLRRLTLRRR